MLASRLPRALGWRRGTQLRPHAASARVASVTAEYSEEASAEALEQAADLGAGAGSGLDEAGASRAVVLGVDPDVNGAVGLLRWRGGGLEASVFDTPSVKVSVGVGAKARLRLRHDPAAMSELLASLALPRGTLALLERPHARHGVATINTAFQSGCGLGLWWGLLTAHGFNVRLLLPGRWKASLNLASTSAREVSKDDSRALAALVLPSLAGSVGRAKDHGRAEALLIAAFGAIDNSGGETLAAPPAAPTAAGTGERTLETEVQERLSAGMALLAGPSGRAESARLLEEAAVALKSETAARKAAAPKPPKLSKEEKRVARAARREADVGVMTCEQLRMALEYAGLKKSGSKAELVERLRAAQAAK